MNIVTITAHTEHGSFTSKLSKLTNAQMENLKESLQEIVQKGNHLTLATDNGVVILGPEILKKTIFVIKTEFQTDKT